MAPGRIGQPAVADREMRMRGLAASIRGLGPYAAMALLLPGGSLIAPCIWLMRHGAGTAIQRRRGGVVAAALWVMVFCPGGAGEPPSPQWRGSRSLMPRQWPPPFATHTPFIETRQVLPGIEVVGTRLRHVERHDVCYR